MARFPRTIGSADAMPLQTDNEVQYPLLTEYSNSLTLPEMPDYSLDLKRGTKVIPLRNSNVEKGLCNDT